MEEFQGRPTAEEYQKRNTVEEQNFGWALHHLRAGEAVSREGWNGPKQYLRLQLPDADSANTMPYVWIRTVQGDRVPWLCSQTDMLATDWVLAAT